MIEKCVSNAKEGKWEQMKGLQQETTVKKYGNQEEKQKKM